MYFSITLMLRKDDLPPTPEVEAPLTPDMFAAISLVFARSPLKGRAGTDAVLTLISLAVKTEPL
jgi:hypothetical protein